MCTVLNPVQYLYLSGQRGPYPVEATLDMLLRALRLTWIVGRSDLIDPGKLILFLAREIN